jgi:hypothetical protein
MSITVEQALRYLGSTPENVETSIRSWGLGGRPNCAGTCPITRYIKHRCGGHPIVGIDHIYPDGHGYFIELPEPVRRFIHRFDSGDIDLDAIGDKVMELPRTPVNIEGIVG